MFTSKYFQDKNKILDIYNTYNSWFYHDYPQIDKLHFSKTECSGFWIDFICSFKEHLKKREVNKTFSFNFFKLVFANYYYLLPKRDLEFIIEAYPKLLMIPAIRTSCFQWYNVRQNTNFTIDCFNKLIDLPQPFNEKKFSVDPIYTDCNKQGLNHSEWSLDRKGGYIKCFDEDKKAVYYSHSNSSYRCFYMDSKIGLIFYFKDKPSIKNEQEHSVYNHAVI